MHSLLVLVFSFPHRFPFHAPSRRLRELANDTLPLNPSPPSVPASATNTPADQHPNSISSDPTPPQFGKSIDILSLFKQAAAPTHEQDGYAPPSQPTGDPALPQMQPVETASTHISPTTAPVRDDRGAGLLNQLFFNATLSDQSAAPAAPIVDPANPTYVPSSANNLVRHDPASVPLLLQPSSSTIAKSVMDGRSLLALLQPDAAIPPLNPPGPTQQPHLYASSFPPPSTSSVFLSGVSSPHVPPSAAASFSQPFGPRETSAYRPLSPKGAGPSTAGIGLMGLRTLGGAPPLVPGRAFDITREEIGRRFVGGGANGMAIGANGLFAAGSGGKFMSKPEFIQQFLNLVQVCAGFIYLFLPMSGCSSLGLSISRPFCSYRNTERPILPRLPLRWLRNAAVAATSTTATASTSHATTDAAAPAGVPKRWRGILSGRTNDVRVRIGREGKKQGRKW